MQVLPLLTKASVMCAELAKDMVPYHGLRPGFFVKAHESRKDVEQILPPISYHKSPVVVGRPGSPCRPFARAI
eukprot:3346020-Prorocentrum_lima.AAC.1